MRDHGDTILLSGAQVYLERMLEAQGERPERELVALQHRIAARLRRPDIAPAVPLPGEGALETEARRIHGS